ncbi:RHS repeat-associated core domain-containing protein [Luteibacter sp. UNCMF331Sha3.1]|uniref:RHS repeat-associated core domain-containing protein n=1 Tax=Luteibacter sp. UNCMF331Sha3.1 TaxID=1502760 RepID=UPI00147A246A|nr:RHS repeat-associated core domain-containing protein [Luteibacter sp. UNCMF331Sha3.1]
MTAQRIALVGDAVRYMATSVSPEGRTLTETGADGVPRTFTYDNAGRLVRLGEPVLVTTFSYDGLSRLARRRTRIGDSGRALTEHRRYDALGRIDTVTIAHDGVDGQRTVHFGWRPDGKLATRRWEDADRKLVRDEAFAYDARGRLVDHTIRFARAGEYPRDAMNMEFVAQHFVFDAIDNLIQVDTTLRDGRVAAAVYEHDQVDTDRVLRVRHRLPEYGPDLVLSYDANGNMTHDGAATSLHWDEAGRLESITVNGETRTYQHGPGGRICASREGSRTAWRFHSEGRLTFETSGDEHRRYVRATGVAIAETHQIGATSNTWLLGTDPQGSVVTEYGDAARTRVYEAHGWRNLDDAQARTAFAGEVAESTGGYYLLGERLYCPVLRRFLSVDPVSPFDDGGLNRYAYCLGDPINRIDPSGNASEAMADAISGLVLALIGVAITAVSILTFTGPGLAVPALATLYSSASGITLLASAVLDTSALVAAVGDIVALENDDEGLGRLFGSISHTLGYVGFGMSAFHKRIGRAGSNFVRTATEARRTVTRDIRNSVRRFVGEVGDTLIPRPVRRSSSTVRALERAGAESPPSPSAAPAASRRPRVRFPSRTASFRTAVRSAPGRRAARSRPGRQNPDDPRVMSAAVRRPPLRRQAPMPSDPAQPTPAPSDESLRFDESSPFDLTAPSSPIDAGSVSAGSSDTHRRAFGAADTLLDDLLNLSDSSV